MTIIKTFGEIVIQNHIFDGEFNCNLLFEKKNAVASLCLNCDNNDNCFWQENKKTYCEHYQ